MGHETLCLLFGTKIAERESARERRALRNNIALIDASFDLSRTGQDISHDLAFFSTKTAQQSKAADIANPATSFFLQKEKPRSSTARGRPKT